MFTLIAALERKIRTSREGAVSIFVAGLLVVMLGMAGLGTEIGLVLFKRQQQQTAADAAAYGGAVALANGESAAAIILEAKAIAADVGYVEGGANGIVVTVNNPPLINAAQAANPSAVEVIIQQPLTLSIANLISSRYGSGSIDWTVKAFAVATAGAGGGGCAAQLLGGQNPGVTISNGAAVTLKQCGLQVCSTGNSALSMSGSARLNLTDTAGNLSTKQTVSVAGIASITNGALINNVASCTSPTCKASQGACAANVDPYSGVTPPTMPAGCSLGTGKSYGYSASVQVISPGVWCGGVSFGSSAQIKLNPGVYYVNKGSFDVGGAVTMTGTGVTIVLTGSGGSYAAVNSIGNGAQVTLSAPTSGTMKGIVFFGDRNAPWSSQTSQQQNFAGGATVNITGAIYFPTTQVNFNNGITNPSGCTQLLAGTINFQGGANFSNNCAGTGTSSIGGSGVTALVE